MDTLRTLTFIEIKIGICVYARVFVCVCVFYVCVCLSAVCVCVFICVSLSVCLSVCL